MKPIPKWSDAVWPEYRSVAKIAAPLMQQEIDALRQRVKELEADRDQYRMMWLREKEANDLRGCNGKAEQPGVATAPSEVYEAELPHPIDAAFVRWAHNHIDTKLYEGMKGPTDIEGHPV